jgi:hypothetical protein
MPKVKLIQEYFLRNHSANSRVKPPDLSNIAKPQYPRTFRPKK